MFGVDIIVEKGTGHHVVIDINYFPGKCSWYMISTVEEASGSVSPRVLNLVVHNCEFFEWLQNL